MQLLLIYFVTVLASKYIHFEAGLDVLKDLADNGYKYKKGQEVEFNENNYEEYIPFFNIVMAYFDYYSYIYNKGAVLDSLLMDDVIERLSPWEERKYKNKPTKWNIAKVLCQYERHMESCLCVSIPEEAYGNKEVCSNVYYFEGKDGIEILNVEGPFSCKKLDEQLDIIESLHKAVKLNDKKNEDNDLKFSLLFQDILLDDLEVDKLEKEALELEKLGLLDEEDFTLKQEEEMRMAVKYKLNMLLKELLEEEKNRNNDDCILRKKKDKK